MTIATENRDIELLFEEEMPGFRCIVTRQAEGAINLQLQSLATRQTITVPAPAPELWNTPDKLQAMCEQITAEFLMFCKEEPTTSPERDAPPIQLTSHFTEKLFTVFQALGSPK
ncbi:hypothetical protein D3C77_619380 [compost metagenome]